MGQAALGDPVGKGLGARLSVVLIGERPGLSVADSLGIYLTYAPRPGRRDSERNCISNVHGRGGLTTDQAAGKVAWFVREALRRGLTGIGLQDGIEEPLLEGSRARNCQGHEVAPGRPAAALRTAFHRAGHSINAQRPRLTCCMSSRWRAHLYANWRDDIRPAASIVHGRTRIQGGTIDAGCRASQRSQCVPPLGHRRRAGDLR
ncbi:hypothetical protein G4G93_26475 [Methylobacterium sp. DB0501]|nr:hypothetical protein [Methylobacterium sp. DB0501]